MSTLTGVFGYSRQAFYKHRENKAFANEAIEPLIVEKAKNLRDTNPGLGCLKLYLIIKNLFESTGSMPGHDAFIEIMRKHGADGADQAPPLQDDGLGPSFPQV